MTTLDTFCERCLLRLLEDRGERLKHGFTFKEVLNECAARGLLATHNKSSLADKP